MAHLNQKGLQDAQHRARVFPQWTIMLPKLQAPLLKIWLRIAGAQILDESSFKTSGCHCDSKWTNKTPRLGTGPAPIGRRGEPPSSVGKACPSAQGITAEGQIRSNIRRIIHRCYAGPPFEHQEGYSMAVPIPLQHVSVSNRILYPEALECRSCPHLHMQFHIGANSAW